MDTRFKPTNTLYRLTMAEDGGTVPFTCGYCGRDGVGWLTSHYGPEGTADRVRFILCTVCGQGTVIDTERRQYPGLRFGENILGLPEDVRAIYEETRDCFSVNAWTAAEQLCRKLLMHIACEKGGTPGKKFKDYVEYLITTGYITPNMKAWVDRIREYANENVHRLDPVPVERAKDTFAFTAQLLKLVYEMDHRINEYDKNKPVKGDV